jgi:hypothetical protein
MNQKLIYFLAIAIIALGVVGYASAQEMAFHERLAKRFNLDSKEVQEFFQENGSQMRQQKMNKLVENGTISEEQKELILGKKEQLREEYECLKDLEPDERQEKMEQIRLEMQEWAKDNDMSLEFLGRGKFGKSFGRGVCGLKN